jgi:hypothetical protein
MFAPYTAIYTPGPGLTTSIRWPCNCTVHVYFVIHLCDSVWSFEWTRICVGFSSFVYICIAVEHTVINILDSINLIVVPVPRHHLSFQPRMSWSFCVQWVGVKDDCLFCWYWWNCWPSLFKLYFYKTFVLFF